MTTPANTGAADQRIPEKQPKHIGQTVKKVYMDVFRGDLGIKPIIALDPRGWRNHEERRDLAEGLHK